MMTTARTFILVKHPETLLTPEVTAERWQLSERGRAQCVPLAERLRAFAPTAILASTEPKAIETGQLVSRHLKLPFETEIGLHEHDRSNVPLVPRPEFEARMAEFHARPYELVYGRETAEEAHTRFRGTVVRVLRERPGAVPAIVAHGTVMSLLIARANGLDAHAFWLKLTLPSIAVLEAETFRLKELLTNIA